MSYTQLDLPAQVRGDTWVFSFVIQDTNGTAINITNHEYMITLKSDISVLDESAELQIGPTVPSSSDAAAGKVTIVVPGSSTNALVPKTYNYDVQEVDSTGTVSTLLIGKIRVRADVTRTAAYNGSTSVTQSVAGRGIYRSITDTVSPTEIYLDGISGSRLTLQSEGVLAFDALVIGRDNTTGNACAFQLNGGMKKDSSTTQIIGTVGKTILGEDVSGFDANITANDGNDSLKIEVTAASTNTTRWAAEVQYTEVYF
jgi:hypothetical protein